MSSNTSQVDYARSCFKYPTPTPIRGEPTYESLKRIREELCANASSVESELGGGDHGYLGLVLTDQEYAELSRSPPQFVAPQFPGALSIPESAGPVQALGLRSTHEESLRQYRECRNVEKALLRFIQGAMEEEYLEDLLDTESNLITEDIPEVLKRLTDAYGRISTGIVKEKEKDILSMNYTLDDPLVNLYRPVEQLKKLAIAAEIAYSDPQLIEIALTVIRNTGDMESAQKAWNRKPVLEKTWACLKKHFRTARQELKEVRGPTMRQAGLHQANILAAQVREEIAERDSEVLEILRTLGEQREEQSYQREVARASEGEDAQGHVANATRTTDSVQLEILKLLRAMSNKLDDSSRDSSVGSQQSSNGDGSSHGETQRRGQNNARDKKGRDRKPMKTPDNAKLTYRPRTDTGKYCWTHGACAHLGKDCPGPVRSHIATATFQNKQGG